MGKREFEVDTGRYYDNLAEATGQETGDPKTRAPRKEYTEEEGAAYIEEMKTAGRKGLKLPRINLALRPDVYDYVQVMSRVSGQNITQFVNLALRQHMDEHRDLYDKAIEFRNSL